MMIASVGQLIGWEDMVNQRPLTVSMRCLSKTGSLLVCKREDFVKHMSKDLDRWLMFGDLATDRDKVTKNKLR